MGFIKSLFSKKALAIDTVKTQEKLYYAARNEYPDKEPHDWLQAVYLGRRQVIGDDISREGIQLAAETETEMFACLQPPYNAEALALFILYKERGLNKNLYQHYPNFAEKFERYTSQIEWVKDNEPDIYEYLYRKYNPVSGSVLFDDKGAYNDVEKFASQLAEARILIKISDIASTAFLQRKLSIGYGTAAKIIEIMEQQKLISKADGVHPRDINF